MIKVYLVNSSADTKQASDDYINLTMPDWLDLYDNELIVLVGGNRDYVPVHKDLNKN